MSKELLDYVRSPEYKKMLDEHFDEMAARKLKRLSLMKRWIERKNPKIIRAKLHQIIKKNNEDYEKKWWEKGIRPSESNLIFLAFDYAEQEGRKMKPRKDLQCENERYLLFGYVFEITPGQKIVFRIYNTKRKVIFSL
jgi:hypothetical protein